MFISVQFKRQRKAIEFLYFTKFNDNEQVKNAIEEWFKYKGENFFTTGIKKAYRKRKQVPKCHLGLC